MRFEFATATRIVFGPGSLREVGPLAQALGRRALVVTGRSAARAAPLLEALALQGITHGHCAIAGEPTIELVGAGVEQARQECCDFVIAFGGGSAIDAGKAIAALLTNRGELLDYLEVIGRGRPLTEPPVPFIAIPTTSGTGAEVTRNAVLASSGHRLKVSLRSPLMLPRLAVVDPELTYDLPAEITASTGLDALTQLIEPFVSCRANPLTDAFCREGLVRIARSLPRAFEHPHDATARADMALASLCGGLALAKAGLGAVHGFAAPIGGAFPAPHGAVCAALLPYAMEVNLRALRQRQPEDGALRRLQEIAAIVTANPQATADEGVGWVAGLCAALKIAPLRSHGVTKDALPALAKTAAATSSMKGNPIGLEQKEMEEILERAL